MSGLTQTVTDGSLLLAAPVAALAGLVSFLSPCVLPLVPGYLSYVTGLSGVELAGAEPARAVAVPAAVGSGGSVPEPARAVVEPGAVAPVRGRVVAGASLFVLGFSAVFVSAGVAFGGLGGALQQHALGLSRILGAVTVVLGLGFMGLVPGLARDLRVHRLPRVGLAGAPLLGVLFGLGWAPCIGPTLAAVQALAFTSASAWRGAVLSIAYCVGLGLPFVVAAVAFRRALGAFALVRRHARAVSATGGLLLVVIGLLLVTGAWNSVTIWLRHLVAGYTTVL